MALENQKFEQAKKVEQQKNATQKLEQSLDKALISAPEFKDFRIDEKTQLKKLLLPYLNKPSGATPNQKWKEIINIINKFKHLKTPKQLIGIISDYISKLNKTPNINKPKLTPNINKSSTNNLNALRNLRSSSEEHKNIRKKLLENYQKLNPQLRKFSQEQITQTQQSIAPDTQKKLTRAGISPQEYAKFLLSQKAIFDTPDASKDPNAQEFLESLKALEKNLNINRENLTPSSPVADKEVFKKNPDLLSYAKEKNQEADFKSLNTLLSRSEMRSRKQNSDFVKKFGTKDLKELLWQVAPLFDQQGNLKSPLTQQEDSDFKAFRKQLVDHKLKLSAFTANLCKGSIIQAPIYAFSQHLDQNTLGGKTLDESFLLSRNACQIQHTEQGKIMQLQWKIDGKPISFEYNLDKPNASLQTNDTLNFDPLNNRLAIWEQAKTDLNIQLPTTAELTQQLKNQISPEVCEQLLQDSDNFNEYQAKLSELIHETLSQSFAGNQEEISARLCQHIEKNLTTQEFFAGLLPPHLSNQLHDAQTLNNSPALKKFLIMFDFSSEHFSSAEHQSLRNGLQKLRNLTADRESIAKIQDPVLKSQLLALHDSMQHGASLEQWTQAMLDFFNLFLWANIASSDSTFDSKSIPLQQSLLNPADLHAFLSAATLGKPLSEEPARLNSDFSPHFNSKYQHALESQQKKSDNADLASIEIAFEELGYAFA